MDLVHFYLKCFTWLRVDDNLRVITHIHYSYFFFTDYLECVNDRFLFRFLS